MSTTSAGIDPHWFAVGAFADDGPDRPSLVPFAMSRYSEHYGRPIAPADVVLIGDTPRDVHAARAHGCRAVAVATGPYTAAELCQADLVLDDLSCPAPLLEFLETQPAAASRVSPVHPGA
jgi:phosphoglycolate phosphatase